MIKYTAKDLVRRAKQLANLENSEFISWKENIYLLNQCYEEVYQKAIDSGEKFYLKSVSLIPAGGSTENGGTLVFALPDDFYQLARLETVDGFKQIPLRGVDIAPSDFCYELINNTIRVQGVGDKSLRLNYYPVPVSLTYPSESAEMDVDGDSTQLPNTLIDYPNNLFVQIIAYKMAIAYRVKQEADVSGLLALLENVENQFYDMLNRDAFQSIRIANVY